MLCHLAEAVGGHTLAANVGRTTPDALVAKNMLRGVLQDRDRRRLLRSGNPSLKYKHSGRGMELARIAQRFMQRPFVGVGVAVGVGVGVGVGVEIGVGVGSGAPDNCESMVVAARRDVGRGPRNAVDGIGGCCLARVVAVGIEVSAPADDVHPCQSELRSCGRESPSQFRSRFPKRR